MIVGEIVEVSEAASNVTYKIDDRTGPWMRWGGRDIEGQGEGERERERKREWGTVYVCMCVYAYVHVCTCRYVSERVRMQESKQEGRISLIPHTLQALELRKVFVYDL